MFTDDFTHQIGSVFNVQTTALLAKQSAVAQVHPLPGHETQPHRSTQDPRAHL